MRFLKLPARTAMGGMLGAGALLLASVGCAGPARTQGEAKAQKAAGTSLPGGSPDVTGVKMSVAKSDALNRSVNGRLDRRDSTMEDGSHYEMHELNLGAGDSVRLLMQSGEFDAFLQLLRVGPDGFEAIAIDDDSGGGTDALIEVTVNEAGRYLVIANGLTSVDLGEYALTVSVEPGQGGGRAQHRAEGGGAGGAQLTMGGTVRGDLARGDDMLADGSFIDYVRFSGRRGDLVEFALDSDDFDTVLFLLTENGGGLTELSSNDDAEGTNSRLRVELPANGEYILGVNAFSAGERGSYRLSARQVPDAARALRADPATLFPADGDPDDRFALLVGIDDYPGERSDLASCVTDTREMRRILVDMLGFREENIVILNDADATRDNIIQGFRRHLAQAGPDGVALFYYSGHGMQMEGNFGPQDDEPDGLDEALYVWGEDASSSVVLDDELGILIGELRTQRVVTVLDSCHAGTGTLGTVRTKAVSMKDPWVKDSTRLPERFIESSPRGRAGSSRREADLMDGPDDHVLLAASASDEFAQAGTNGRPSVFTYFLVRELEAGGYQMSFDELARRVSSAVARYVRDDLQLDSTQSPRAEGRARTQVIRIYLGL